MLNGLTAVITGGTSGIGEATVKLFAENHANVVFVGTNAEKGENVLKKLREAKIDANARFQHCDVSREDDVRELAAFVRSEFSGCDILFNNAGIHLAGRLLETTPADFDRILSVDLRGVWLCCYYIMPMMLENQRGTIINMSSVSGISADYSMCAYNAAKGAVTNLTRAIAIDYLLLELFMLDAPVRYEDLADQLCVSRKTVIEDIRHVRESESDTAFDIEPGKYGIQYMGTERCIRSILIRRMLELYTISEIWLIFSGGTLNKSIPIENRVAELVSGIDSSAIERSLRFAEANDEKQYSDDMFYLLASLGMFSVCRVQRGKQIGEAISARIGAAEQ